MIKVMIDFFRLADGTYVMVTPDWNIHGGAEVILGKMQELQMSNQEISKIFLSLELSHSESDLPRTG
jgi:hypothetical protein